MTWLLTLMIFFDDGRLSDTATIVLDTQQECEMTANNVLELYGQLGIHAETECVYTEM